MDEKLRKRIVDLLLNPKRIIVSANECVIDLSARDAILYKDAGSYWREWCFVIGTVILAVGLLTVGFTGRGAERTICLIMIAIITFSIYIIITCC